MAGDNVKGGAKPKKEDVEMTERRLQPKKPIKKDRMVVEPTRQQPTRNAKAIVETKRVVQEAKKNAAATKRALAKEAKARKEAEDKDLAVLAERGFTLYHVGETRPQYPSRNPFKEVPAHAYKFSRTSSSVRRKIKEQKDKEQKEAANLATLFASMGLKHGH